MIARETQAVRNGWLRWAVPLAICAGASLALVLTAPHAGQFLWSESPRNALNGAFVLDLVRAMPVHDPAGWAENYYLRYPALTILFYPPLLYAVLAVFYAVFGVSHATAVACIGSFAFALLLGTWTLARRVASSAAALAGALLLLAAPETVRWGQQVMLEVPMLALITWAAVFLARYGDRLQQGRTDPASLAISATLLVAAAYTKQTSLFVAAGLAIGLLVWQGAGLLRCRHIWLVALAAIAALIPLALMQLCFGAFNVTSVVNRADMTVPSRLSLAGLDWYAVRLPHMLGWPALVATLLFPVLAALRRDWRLRRGDALLLGGWLLVTYTALTAIDLKETRHGMPLLVPLAVLAAASLDRLLPRRLGHPAAAIAAMAILSVMLWRHPVVGVAGYRQAAELIGREAPPNARVLFSGNHDGAFIFNIRTLPRRRDISVLRADKLFLNIAIMPQLGLDPRNLDRAQVAALLNRIGIAYVVAVPNQWIEAPVMRAFAEVLASPQFTKVASVKVTGPVAERVLDIYRNNGPLASPPAPYAVTLRAAKVTFGKN